MRSASFTNITRPRVISITTAEQGSSSSSAPKEATSRSRSGPLEDLKGVGEVPPAAKLPLLACSSCDACYWHYRLKLLQLSRESVSTMSAVMRRPYQLAAVAADGGIKIAAVEATQSSPQGCLGPTLGTLTGLRHTSNLAIAHLPYSSLQTRRLASRRRTRPLASSKVRHSLSRHSKPLSCRCARENSARSDM